MSLYNYDVPEYVLTILSSDHSEQISENTNSSFLNLLPEPLDLNNREYEVALCELMYTDTNIIPEITSTTPEKISLPKLKFFTNTNNKLKVSKQYDSRYYITKATVADSVPFSILGFIEALNKYFAKSNAPIFLQHFVD